MKKWKTYNSSLTNDSYDAIIIGSGIGGLCTAALLGLNGKRVLVLEKHFKIGGWTHTFRRKQYEWDVGIHYIGQVHRPNSPIRRLFDLISDNQLKWSAMDENYDKIIFPDKSYNFFAPREKFIENMLSYFPDEESAITSYMDLLDKVAKSSRQFFKQKTFSGILDTLTYPIMTKNFFQYSDITTYDVLSNLTNNNKLIGVLTGQWGDYGLPPKLSSFAMHAFVARHYLEGGNYPTGSSRRIAETISDLIEKNGGILAVNAGVKRIITHKGKSIGVKMDNGDIIESKDTISSVGVFNTINRLLKNDSSNKFAYKHQLNTIQQTKSYVCLHLGINKSIKDLNIKNTNLWIYPDYGHDEIVQRYIDNPKSEFPVVYVSFPSAKDDAWDKTHPNQGTMEAITLSRWGWYQNWEQMEWKKRGKEYEVHKRELSERMLNVIIKHVKGIEHHIDYKELSTPLTVRDLANYQKGEMYGIDHSPNRFRQRWLRPKSMIDNLYYTGQDITTVGVSSALFSGLLTASSVMKKDLSKMLRK